MKRHSYLSFYNYRNILMRFFSVNCRGYPELVLKTFTEILGRTESQTKALLSGQNPVCGLWRGKRRRKEPRVENQSLWRCADLSGNPDFDCAAGIPGAGADHDSAHAKADPAGGCGL